jgi:homoserine kinase type II
MPRGRAHFTSEELARVLSHYDVGAVHQAGPLFAGSSRAPKVVVHADRGSFLLKRRPCGRDNLEIVTFAHAVQSHLASQSFPVTPLVATRDERKTILDFDNKLYELFRFVDGTRYDGSTVGATEAGRQLGRLHVLLSDFPRGYEPFRTSFHDSDIVRQHLAMIRSDNRSASVGRMEAVSRSLSVRYDRSSARVNRFGFDRWPRQVVHGDWHPGNLLFSSGEVVGVVDFDAVRVSQPATDLANGMLQFSIIGDLPDPNDWPEHFDRAQLLAFFAGYRQVAPLSKYELCSLVDLMVETMIAEAVLPVAATGFFGHHSGLDFLQMIVRKTKWLRHNRRELTETMLASSPS